MMYEHGMHLPFVLAELERLGEEAGSRIRSRQKALLLREICLMKEPSRRALVHRLGLRSSSVSSTLDDLLTTGLVMEVGRQTKNDRGRPRLILAPNMDSRVAISLYVEHLRLCGGIVNLEEKILLEQEVLIPKNAGSDEFLQAFEELVALLLRSVPPETTILGVAFSPVGAVDRESKRWINCNRWPNVHDVDFTPLEEKFGLPVIIRRNLETLLGYEVQTTREYQNANIVLFHWGYGIGSAYSHEGVVMETERGNYSGIGHTLINPQSQKRCQCGALGCLEAEAAIWALLPQYNAADPGNDVKQDDGYYELLSRALFGNIPFLDEAVQAVRIGLYNLCKMLSPEYVLFLSPFASNHKLVNTLKECVESSFPHEVHYEPEFRVLGGSFRGSLYANVYPLFREELQRIIGGAGD
jgi:predicted NBD/HSP70 family sugar kinase